jgi:hypothetical protein
VFQAANMAFKMYTLVSIDTHNARMINDPGFDLTVERTIESLSWPGFGYRHELEAQVGEPVLIIGVRWPGSTPRLLGMGYLDRFEDIPLGHADRRIWGDGFPECNKRMVLSQVKTLAAGHENANPGTFAADNGVWRSFLGNLQNVRIVNRALSTSNAYGMWNAMVQAMQAME